MNSHLGHLYPPVHLRMMHLCTVGMAVLVLVILIPATVLDTIEPGWSWGDSLYYCFISLTTVGLGDFIPGDDPQQEARSVYKTGVTVYLVLGLVAVMLLLNIWTSVPELDLTGWFRDTATLETE